MTVTVTVGASATQSLEVGVAKAWHRYQTSASNQQQRQSQFSHPQILGNGKTSFNLTNSCIANDQLVMTVLGGNLTAGIDAGTTRYAGDTNHYDTGTTFNKYHNASCNNHCGKLYISTET